MAKRRKKAAGGGGGGGMSAEDAFAVMFTSLNLILLSFFILLNSIAVVDNNRQRRALGSLRGSFGILLGGENPDSNSGKSLHREMPFEMQQGAEGGKMLREAQALVSRTRLVHGTNSASMIPTADGLRIVFNDRILLRPGTTVLHPSAFPLLDGVAKIARRYRVRATVRGYADPTRPVHFPSNVELSGSRAARVADYLVRAAKLPPALVRAVAMGVRDGVNSRHVEIEVGGKRLRGRLELDSE
ncbi:MAG: OmpA family protein [Myxococcales bacterium]|nr:OmpA family protein [Myxococcales bacterium]